MSRLGLAGIVGICAWWLAGCERPPVDDHAGRLSWAGMEQLVNPRTLRQRQPKTRCRRRFRRSGGGPAASSVYQNIQVLKDLNVAQFARVMVAITQWVAPPDQSCNYCHGANMASDDRYPRSWRGACCRWCGTSTPIGRIMSAQTGVTCYTCHRGNAVPQNVWFTNPGESSSSGLIAGNAGQEQAVRERRPHLAAV
jgi:photosynthetic reaction center cytochrome c subunit